MRVKDVIEQLQKLNPELEVIMSADSEGNWYNPLIDIEVSDTVIGENEPMHPDDAEEFDADELEEIVVLWP